MFNKFKIHKNVTQGLIKFLVFAMIFSSVGIFSKTANASCYYGPAAGDYSNSSYSDGTVTITSITNELGQDATNPATPSQGTITVTGTMQSYAGTWTDCVDGFSDGHVGIYWENDSTDTESAEVVINGVSYPMYSLTGTQTGNNYWIHGNSTSGCCFAVQKYSFSETITVGTSGTYPLQVVGTYTNGRYRDAYTDNYGMVYPTNSSSPPRTVYIQATPPPATCSISVSRSLNSGAIPTSAFTSGTYEYEIYGSGPVTTVSGDHTYSNLAVGSYTIIPRGTTTAGVSYNSQAYIADAGTNSVGCTANTTAPLPMPYQTEPKLEIR